jgi:hypothetical protein
MDTGAAPNCLPEASLYRLNQPSNHKRDLSTIYLSIVLSVCSLYGCLYSDIHVSMHRTTRTSETHSWPVDTTSDCICANGTCSATPFHAAASQADAALLARMFTDDEVGLANRCAILAARCRCRHGRDAFREGFYRLGLYLDL